MPAVGNAAGFLIINSEKFPWTSTFSSSICELRFVSDAKLHVFLCIPGGILELILIVGF